MYRKCISLPHLLLACTQLFCVLTRSFLRNVCVCLDLFLCLQSHWIRGHTTALTWFFDCFQTLFQHRAQTHVKHWCRTSTYEYTKGTVQLQHQSGVRHLKNMSPYCWWDNQHSESNQGQMTGRGSQRLWSTSLGAAFTWFFYVSHFV